MHAGPHGAKRLIAWISPYAAGNVNSTGPEDPTHVATAHPDWLSARADGATSKRKIASAFMSGRTQAAGIIRADPLDAAPRIR